MKALIIAGLTFWFAISPTVSARGQAITEAQRSTIQALLDSLEFSKHISFDGISKIGSKVIFNYHNLDELSAFRGPSRELLLIKLTMIVAESTGVGFDAVELRDRSELKQRCMQVGASIFCDAMDVFELTVPKGPFRSECGLC